MTITMELFKNLPEHIIPGSDNETIYFASLIYTNNRYNSVNNS